MDVEDNTDQHRGEENYPNMIKASAFDHGPVSICRGDAGQRNSQGLSPQGATTAKTSDTTMATAAITNNSGTGKEGKAYEE